MQNVPTAKELLKGVVQFLERDVVPVLEEPLRFHTRVAANLLKIIEREWELETAHLRKERDRLIQLLGVDAQPSDTPDALRNEVTVLNDMLCREIQAGRADRGPRRKEVFDHIRTTLIDTLAITNPKIAGNHDRAKGPSEAVQKEIDRDA